MLDLIILVAVCLLFFLPAFRRVSRRQYGRAFLFAFAGIVVFKGIYLGESLYTDFLWFQEVGYTQRFWKLILVKVAMSSIGGLIAAVAGCATVLAWNRSFTKAKPEFAGHPNRRLLKRACMIAQCFAFIVFGLGISAYWNELLLYLNAVPFGQTEPVFNKDIGFYIFSLPFIKVAAGFAESIFLYNIVLIMVLYFLEGLLFRDTTLFQQLQNLQRISLKSMIEPFLHRLITHLAMLSVAGALIVMVDTFVSRWELLYSHRGVVYGAGWTDLNVQLPAYNVMIAVLVICAVAFSISVFARSTQRTILTFVAGVALFLVVKIFGVGIIPEVLQHFRVSPNELPLETPYLERNIAFTRDAYGLNRITEINYPVNTSVEPLSKDDKVVVENIRLWDPRILEAANNQNQALRLYYYFSDVAVDRYPLNGKLTQLMLSLRELNVERLAPQSKTWQNLRLVYTHGYGVVAAPVNRFGPEGLPDYVLKDIPPTTPYPELKLDQPRIYFGEETFNLIYVNTRVKEFDYPKGDANAEYNYQGKGGIRLDTFFKKLFFALRFEGIRMFTTQELTSQSRVMFRRDISTRVKAIAPFLRYDSDIYYAVADGRIYFIWDAYTTGNTYPYSQPVTNDRINYIRNSVKVVVDAYNGTVTFYIADKSDPVVQAYAKAFPGMFRDIAAMPASLRQHIRYPEDMLNIQSSIYTNYHMNNAHVFYNREDAWEVSRAAAKTEEAQHVTPYYLISRLPDSDKEEFVLALPFSPYSGDKNNPRNNMVSLLIARCDGDKYGKLVLYKFPKDKQVYGPLQIGIRINQDETISKDLTLWNQQGSSVVFGNLLAIPLSNFRVMYVQPIYLQASVGKMPELRRVVVVFGDQLSYGTSFEDALNKFFAGGYRREAVTAKETSVKTEIPGKDLINSAVKHYDEYRSLMGQGKYSEAGKALEELGRVLGKIKK
ncbi:MAG: UPF0182 family protein [Nitrospirae bacterium]|nr:UPF0182 family protein [Nitrospirota bacterium]